MIPGQTTPIRGFIPEARKNFPPTGILCRDGHFPQAVLSKRRFFLYAPRI